MQQQESAFDRISREITEVRKIKDKNVTDKLVASVQNQLLDQRLPYAVFLFGTGFLADLVNTNHKAKHSILALCYTCSPSIFDLEKDKISRETIEQTKKSKQYQQTLQSKQAKESKQNKFTQKLRTLIESVGMVVLQFGKNPENLKKAVTLGYQITCIESDHKAYTPTPFEQYAINYVNFCLENVRKKVQSKHICCKTSYRERQQIEFGEGPSQEFKRYIWPINNVSIKNHLTKTIVGFLNSHGGIIFIGIMENKDKKNDVVGIALKPTEVKPIKDLINELVGTIHPKHEGFGLPSNQEKGTVNNSNFNYKINDYIKMQFMRVVDEKETFTNVQVKNQKKEYLADLYIVKIIVKIGHPKHLYHIINNEKNIDFFQRKDRNVQKMQFPDAYDKIYDRLDKFQQFKEKYRSSTFQEAAAISSLDRQPFHSNCRYEMNDITLFLQEDKIDDEDDDDDDE